MTTSTHTHTTPLPSLTEDDVIVDADGDTYVVATTPTPSHVAGMTRLTTTSEHTNVTRSEDAASTDTREVMCSLAHPAADTTSVTARELTAGDRVLSPSRQVLTVDASHDLAGSAGRWALTWNDGNGNVWEHNVSADGGRYHRLDA